jgi:hypothetical protein
MAWQPMYRRRIEDRTARSGRIMVGEVRDPETAQIAIQAALTGRSRANPHCIPTMSRTVPHDASRSEAARIAGPLLPLSSTAPGQTIVLAHASAPTRRHGRVAADCPGLRSPRRTAAPLTSPQALVPNLSDRLVHATLGIRAPQPAARRGKTPWVAWTSQKISSHREVDVLSTARKRSGLPNPARVGCPIPPST